MKTLAFLTVFLPLLGSLASGIFGTFLGRRFVALVTTTLVGVSFLLSLFVLSKALAGQGGVFPLYTWLRFGGTPVSVGFWVDPVSALMLAVVTFVSFLVHIYSAGYMADDPGWPRFFSYISLFTFFMLMLVTAANFVQLFFGWEGVGLVSYLLIGFWFERPRAPTAGLKAFLLNRVGDISFALGMGVVFWAVASLDFSQLLSPQSLALEKNLPLFFGVGLPWQTAAALLLFGGAMAKSAQIPLHAWLPDSMEGPTPISALIHAATMVTAGIFMVARLSPFFAVSTTALLVILWIGVATALLMGLVGLVQSDIKRVVAYSTLSQLGYMVAALGAGAFSASLFHLTTHAFFKALLFLAAGSVIVALHHEQDMRKMGGLWRALPITYICALVGALALCGIPPFSGYFSKDLIIEAVNHCAPGGRWASAILELGAFVTAAYTFRMIFMVFHGAPRGHHHEAKEPGASVVAPLVALAVPALAGGIWLIPLGMGGFFRGALESAKCTAHLAPVTPGFWGFLGESLAMPSVWLALIGIAAAWIAVFLPAFEKLARLMAPGRWILREKYGFDFLYETILAPLAVLWGWVLGWIDRKIVDGLGVMGLAQGMKRLATAMARLEVGVFSAYAFAMILGVLAMLTWMLGRI